MRHRIEAFIDAHPVAAAYLQTVWAFLVSILAQGLLRGWEEWRDWLPICAAIALVIGTGSYFAFRDRARLSRR